MSLTTHTILRLAAVAGVACLPACHQPLNGSINPGPVPLSVYAEPDADATVRPPDGPSLPEGHDRSSWRPLAVDVYVNRTESQPISELSPQYLQRTPRQRGDFPTTANAVDVTPSGWEQVEDSSLEAVTGLAAIFAAPIQFVASFSEYNVQRSPNWQYERMPARHVEDLDRWYRAP